MVPLSISLLHGESYTTFRVALLRDYSICPLPCSPGTHKSCCKPKCTNTDRQKWRKSQAIPHAPSSTEPSFSLLLAEQATGFRGNSHPHQLTLPKSRKASLQHLLHWRKSVREPLFLLALHKQGHRGASQKGVGTVSGGTGTLSPQERQNRSHSIWIFLFSCCLSENRIFSWLKLPAAA